MMGSFPWALSRETGPNCCFRNLASRSTTVEAVSNEQNRLGRNPGEKSGGRLLANLAGCRGWSDMRRTQRSHSCFSLEWPHWKRPIQFCADKNQLKKSDLA